MTTPAEVRAKIQETIAEIIDDFKDEPETDREILIERMDEDCDTLFGQLVKQGRIDQYTVDDLVETAADCAAIIKLAEQDAWVEDDHGLWDGLTYGVLASIAYEKIARVSTRQHLTLRQLPADERASGIAKHYRHTPSPTG